ncbi:hypothetical protein D3C80_1337720 [compost metagenome]
MRALDLLDIASHQPDADPGQDQDQHGGQGVDRHRHRRGALGLTGALGQTPGLDGVYGGQLDPHLIHQGLALAAADQRHRLADAPGAGQGDGAVHQRHALMVKGLDPRDARLQFLVLADQVIQPRQHGRQLGHGAVVNPQIFRPRRQHEAALPRLGVGQKAEHVLGRQTNLLAVIDGVVIGRRPLDHDEGGGVHRQQQQDGQRQQGDDRTTEGRRAQEGAKGPQGRPNAFHDSSIRDRTP